MIEVREATLRDASYIAANMRPEDRMELASYGSPVDAPALLALNTLNASPGFCWCVFERGQPIAAYGCAGTPWPHIAQAWAWGTPRFHRAVPTITATHERIRRNLAAVGIRRLQAISHGAHETAHRWLEGPMQFEREGVMRAFGMDGADFVLYGFTRFE